MNYNHRRILKHCQGCGNLTKKTDSVFNSRNELIPCKEYTCNFCDKKSLYYKSKNNLLVMIVTKYCQMAFDDKNFIMGNGIDSNGKLKETICFSSLKEMLAYNKKLKQNLEFT